MTSYDDTKVQLTINRMTEECYENVPDKSSTELYLISQDPTSIAKIDLDAQSRTDAEISSIQSDLNALSSEVSVLSEWTTTQIDDLTGDVQEVSSQAVQNAQDIADISANLTHSTVRRWEYVEYNGLTFTAEEANSTIAMQKVGSAPDVSLEYSTGNGWNDFIVSSTEVEGTTVTLPNIGDQMVIRAKTTNSGFASSGSAYNQFVMTGKIAASGSIMYLLKNDGDIDTISSNHCFWGMFRNCSSLTTAPELPATTLQQYCYSRMFNGCTSLTTAPELPATTLALSCYDHMFNGCTSLTTPPELPATTLAEGCYASMFESCTSLTTAPELPATTLTRYCYSGMFRSCSSLTQAPELPATTLASYCYQNMFYECTNLNEIKISYTGTFSEAPSQAFYYWVLGVSSSGTFYYDGEDTTTGVSAIPTGWDVQPLVPQYQGLTFTAEEANSTIAMQKVGSAPDVSLEYSTGNGWNDFIVGETTVTLPNIGDQMVIRAKTTNSGMGSSGSQTIFVMTGKIAASDSIMYLLKNDGDLNSITSAYCFNQLFNGCTSLTSAPELPATTLANYCYVQMFSGCTSLTIPPVLPATTLATSCYSNMFSGCTSLTTTPELPATSMSQGGYYRMFIGCTSLTQAPELPATTLAQNCYYGMFRNCSSLTTAPELPVTTLARGCYDTMFQGCTSLTQAPELPATTLADTCYSYMFNNCTSLTTAPELPATTLMSGCYRGMFNGCSSLNEIKIDYTGDFTNVPTNAFTSWVDGVAASGTFYYNGSDTTTGTSAIPEGWTVQSF